MNKKLVKGFIRTNCTKQKEELQNYCLINNFELTKIYESHELNDLMKNVKKGDNFIITNLFEFSPITYDMLMDIIQNRKTKSHIIYLSHYDIDANTAQGKYLLMNILAWKQYEKDLFILNIKDKI